jgi:hypothetical protein
MENDIKIKFLEKSIDINHALRNSLDYKANFLLAISGIMFTLAISAKIDALIVLSGMAAILCILSISLPFRKINKKNSLLCWWGISNKTFDEYDEAVEEIKSEDDLILEYKKEIYFLYFQSIKFKNKLLKFSSLILLSTFVLYILNIL